MTTTIWHNPRCSKSRLTLALLEEQGIEPVVRLYLEDAPSLAELELVVGQLGMSPWELLRRQARSLARQIISLAAGTTMTPSG